CRILGSLCRSRQAARSSPSSGPAIAGIATQQRVRTVRAKERNMRRDAPATEVCRSKTSAVHFRARIGDFAKPSRTVVVTPWSCGILFTQPCPQARNGRKFAAYLGHAEALACDLRS